MSKIVKCFLFLDEASGGDGISHMKVQKLVYYAQGFHLAIFDEPLFSNQIQAWNHGPVVPSLYKALKKYGKEKIPYSNDFDTDSLPKATFEFIEEIHDVFGKYSAWKLRCMTHNEPPWQKHEYSADVIPVDELKEYFKTRLKN